MTNRFPARALVLVLACAAGSACKPITTDLNVDLILPEDSTDYDATNNVSIVLDPGDNTQFETDGLDFSLEVELDPDDTLRTLAIYLALDTELLGWGRTAEFTLQRNDPVGLFVGRPGKLSSFPLVLDLDDPALQMAHVAGRGTVLLETNGATMFIDEISLEPKSAETLPNPPSGQDGTFVGDSLGGAARVRWNERLAMQRFDVGGDEWIDVDLAGADEIDPRPGAAFWSDADGEALFLFGGGEATSIVAIDLVPPDEGSPGARVVQDVELDAPRAGASATVLLRDDGDEGEVTIVCGGDDDVALVRLVEPQESIGPVGPWTAARCVQVDRGPADAVALRMLCGGGVRAGTPTADVIEVVFGPDGDPTSPQTLDHPDLLGVAMPDVRWFVDVVAVYAQAEGALQPFASADLAPLDVLPALRATGGSTLALPTGATLVAGGVDTDGIPTTRMQLFTPALAASDPVDRN